MNSALSTIATIKASRLTTRLRRRFDIKPSRTAPDLLTLFEVIGYTVLLESDINIGRYKAQRSSNDQVVLWTRLSNALKQINPKVPCEVIETVISGLISIYSSDLLENNRRFHKLLTEGVDVVYHNGDQIVHDKVWFIDLSNLLSNDWLVIHGFNIVEECDIHYLNTIVFINGLPLAVIAYTEFQDKKATLQGAYQQLQSYKQQIPTLFFHNALLIIACRNQARVGTLTSSWKEFLPWCSIDGEAVAGVKQRCGRVSLMCHFCAERSLSGGFLRSKLRRVPPVVGGTPSRRVECGVRRLLKGFPGISKLPLAQRDRRSSPEGEDFPHQGETELEVLIQGIFDKRRFLELVKHFIVFEKNGASISKKLLRYPFCTTQNPKSRSRMI